MKNIFLILAFTLLYTSNIFGQAAVDIPIIAKDQIYCEWILYFGLDLTATDSIDFLLGENYEACYHFPPPCTFFPAWFLPPFQGTLYSCRDYRAPGNPPAFPFTGNIQYSIKFLSENYPVIISWNLPPEIAPTSTIQDILGGGIINKSFSGNDSLVITDSTISQLYLFVDYDNIIPVELNSFTATVLQNENVVQLNWETATETNNSGFEIQRTSTLPSPSQGEGGEAGRGWENIGFVPGFGTTTEPKSYSFIDEAVTTGTYKYRLKQIDFDGSFEFSNEIEVIVDFSPKEFALYQNYPNPFNPTTTIKYEIPGNVILSEAKNLVTLKVFDVLGNEVTTLTNEEKSVGEYKVEWNASEFPSGIYFYQLKAGRFIKTKKMVLMK